jgi:hypothetical protein
MQGGDKALDASAFLADVFVTSFDRPVVHWTKPLAHGEGYYD